MSPADWARLRSTFDEIVDLEVGERSARLAALAQREPDVARLLQPLLDAHDGRDESLRGLSFLRESAVEDSVRSESDPDAPDPLGIVGSERAHFRVKQLLGRGGMGVVYLAEDLRLQRPVALKFLNPHSQVDPAARQRLLLEARAVAALEHPNICTVYEVGETDEGLFIAMPRYSGETLKARLAREGTLAVNAAIDIATQVARGLAAAQEHGLVHRDLKPGNLMLCADGVVRILDFGLVKMPDVTLTGPGAGRGTLRYMSPEQLSGGPVDGRSDLWSLGIVLVEMLTGGPPSRGTHAIEDLKNAIRDRVDDEPTRNRITDIVGKLLGLDASERYASAYDLVNALTPLAGGSGRRSSTTSGWRSVAAARSIWIGLGLLVVIGLAYPFARRAIRRQSTLDVRSVPLERSVAVLPFDNLSAEQRNDFLAGAVHDAVITQLASVPDLRVISRQSVRDYAGTAKPLRQIGEELGVGRIVQASVQRMGERVRVTAQLIDAPSEKYLWANQYERQATDLFALQTDVALAIAGALEAKLTVDERERLTRAPTRNSLAYNFYLQGREYQQRPRGVAADVFALREEDARAAETLFRRAEDLDPAFALAHAQLAQVHGDIYGLGYDRTPARREQMRVEAEAALRLQPDLSEAHLAMGRYWALGGDDARTLAEYEIARRGQPNNAYLQTQLAVVHRKLGRWEEALGELEQAVRLDPRESIASVNLAFTYQAMRRCAEALRAWDRAIELAPDNYRYVMERGRLFVRWQGNTDSLATALRRIPKSYDPEGQITLAWVDLAHFRRRPAHALAAFAAMRPELLEGADFGNISWLRYNRARAYEALGDTARARADFEAALALLKRSVQKNPNDGHVHADLGIVDAWLGRKQEAMREARLALQLVPLSKDAFYAPILMFHGAETYARVGEADAALELLEQLLTIPNFVVSSVHELRLDPRWDPLRSDPRFEDLLQRHRRG